MEIARGERYQNIARIRDTVVALYNSFYYFLDTIDSNIDGAGLFDLARNFVSNALKSYKSSAFPDQSIYLRVQHLQENLALALCDDALEALTDDELRSLANALEVSKDILIPEPDSFGLFVFLHAQPSWLTDAHVIEEHVV